MLAGKVPYVPRERCWPAGVPAFVLEPPFNITIFIETPKEILMIHQHDAQARHIYLNVPHTAHPKPSWTGESVGHYEGGELVVDTIGFNERTFVDNYRTPHTDKMHVVERFKLLDGGKTCRTRSGSRTPAPSTWPGRACSAGGATIAGPSRNSLAPRTTKIFSISTLSRSAGRQAGFLSETNEKLECGDPFQGVMTRAPIT